VALVSLLGRIANRESERRWYRRLKKPAGQPPRWLFAPVWGLLYTLMSLSAVRVARSPRSPARSRALRRWWTQLALNAAWTPLFFGARKPRLALADLAGTALATRAYARSAKKVDRGAAWLIRPYLAWLLYAGWLNAGILRRNPRFAH
jgi:tryptophan-rich sensory protein